MFTWSFSDLHAGMPACYDNFHAFLDDVEKEKPDLLIGVGDIIELTWYSFNHCMGWEPSRDAILHLKDVASKITTYLLPGNHDLNIGDYARELLPMKIIPEGSVKVRPGKVVYIHGHQFDPVYQSTWAWITRLPLVDKIAPCVAKRLYGTPYELKAAGRDESYNRVAGLVETGALLRGVDKIVFGHTHSEFIRTRKDRWSANCGDFTDSCSTLKVIDGEPELVWYK